MYQLKTLVTHRLKLFKKLHLQQEVEPESSLHKKIEVSTLTVSRTEQVSAENLDELSTLAFQTTTPTSTKTKGKKKKQSPRRTLKFQYQLNFQIQIKHFFEVL